MDDPSQNWVAVRRRLRYSLGGVTLWSTWFDAVELTTHVSLLDTDPALYVEQARQLVKKTGGVILPSQPVGEEPSWLVRRGDLLCYVPSVHSHYLVDLAGTFNDYLAKLPKKHRHEINRKVRRFQDAAGGTIDFRVYRTKDDVDEFYPRARQLAARSYQERFLGVAMPSDAAFLDRLWNEAENDSVRGYLLYLADEPIAFGLCFVEGTRVNYTYTGYSANTANLSPGYVLLHQMLSSLFAEGKFRVMSMGGGEGQYKRAFSTRQLRCATYYLFPRSVRNLARIAGHRLCERLGMGAARLLDRLGLKRRVKRLVFALASPLRPAPQCEPDRAPGSSSGREAGESG